jgi:hypothetical protein
MPRRRLQDILSDLQKEVGSGASLTDDDRKSLRDLITSLEDVIDEDTDTEDAPVLEELRNATARFESSHPKLTDTLAGISELLRSIGIS